MIYPNHISSKKYFLGKTDIYQDRENSTEWKLLPNEILSLKPIKTFFSLLECFDRFSFC